MSEDETTPYASWVMIRKKVPTNPSPPGGSIHFARPWPINRKEVAPWNEADLRREKNRELKEAWDNHPVDASVGPRPPGETAPSPGPDVNVKGARAIFYKGEKIRIFPHEFSPISAEGLSSDFAGRSHDWVPINESDERLRQKLEDGVFYMQTRGVSKSWAIVRMVQGLSDEDVPPVGWWKMKVQYRLLFDLTF